MILVDSSVWIDYFRGKETPETDRLDALLGVDVLATGDLMLTEVLQGFQREADYVRARRLLTSMEIVTLGGAEIGIRAAQNFRRLRAKGITVRKTIDTIIATRCIVSGYALLFSDRDFAPFVDHLGLQSALPSPGHNNAPCRSRLAGEPHAGSKSTPYPPPHSPASGLLHLEHAVRPSQNNARCALAQNNAPCRSRLAGEPHAGSKPAPYPPPHSPASGLLHPEPAVRTGPEPAVRPSRNNARRATHRHPRAQAAPTHHCNSTSPRPGSPATAPCARTIAQAD